MGSRSTAIEVAPRGVFGFSLLTGAICGVAMVRYEIALPVIAFGLLAGSTTIFYGRRFGFLALAALISGIVAANIQLIVDKPLGASYRQMTVRLADANQTSIRELPSPTFILGSLRQNGEEIPVAIQLPRGSRASVYGAVLTGFAEIAPSPDATGSFGAYCASHRLRGIVRFRSFRQTGEEKGTLGNLLTGRDFLLRRLIRHIKSDDARSIGAALLFGVRSGMRGELRQKFVDAGTVHLFSVSGMHVAVLAAILLAVLRFCPLKPRYISVIAVLGIYTLVTGANPPAVRAFCLIGAWALGRAFLREIPVAEILGAIGSAMLLANPALLGDIGAQYSFFITALLVASGEFFRREGIDAPQLLMAGDEKRNYLKQRRIRMFLPQTLFFCATAFAGSIGITLLAGNDLRPGSIIANLLFSVGAVPLFAVGLATLAVPVIGSLFGELLLAAMHWCEACGELFPRLDYTAPAAWQVALFLFALLFGFFTRRLKFRLAGWATAAALFLFWVLPIDAAPDVVGIFQGDAKSSPALVIVESRFHRAICINLPDYRAKAELEKILCDNGVTSIEGVYLTENRRRNCGCLAQLQGAYRPKRLIAAKGKIPADLTRFLEENAHRGAPETALPNDFCRISADKTGFSLDYFSLRDNVSIKLVLRDGDPGRNVRGQINGKAWFEICKPWAKNPKVWSFNVPAE